ncbi:hypothetical protein MASR1M107_32250 [Ignavibacteriales bacterium]
MRKTTITFVFFVLTTFTYSQTHDPNMWMTNGVVNSVTQSGNTIYLGGTFDYVGKYSGNGGVINPETGEVDNAMPEVNGLIRCVISDGTGGWYIGGDFTKVGDFTRNRIARIKPDKTVDADFNPNCDGPVYSILLNGGSLFVGGAFLILVEHRGDVSQSCHPQQGLQLHSIHIRVVL